MKFKRTNMESRLKTILDALEQYIHKAYQTGNKYDFIDPAYELCQELEMLEQPFLAVEPLLQLIERSPDIDYGGPGPLGSFMESFYQKGYEEKLTDSVSRQPTTCTLHLLERMIQDPDDPRQSSYLSLMAHIALDASQPEHIQSTAKENLVFLIDNLYTDDPALKTQLAMWQKLLEITADNYQAKQQALQTMQPPVEKVNYQGISFKVINHQQAEALLPDISDLPGLEKLYDIHDEWRFPTYYENGFFLLAAENIIAEKLELNYHIPDVAITILGFIFLKNLDLGSHLIAFDTDNSPALVVLGDVRCPYIHLYGNIHYLGGKVITDLLWAKYNHGELYINGSLETRVVLADDMQVFIRKVDEVKALISLMGMHIYIKQVQGEAWLQEPSTHGLEDAFLPDLLLTNEDGDIILADELSLARLKAGEPILKDTIS